MDYIKITRFSDDGFSSQLQNRYIKDKYLSESEITNPDFNKGVWVFVQNHEDKYLLNHLELSKIPYLKCWEAQIPLSTRVFKHDNPYELSAVSIVEIEKDEGVFFIPESSLSEVINIKATNNCFLKD